MKGILHKTERGWIVLYDEIIGENIIKKNQNSLPLHPDSQTWMDGYNLYEGKEVDFEIVIAYINYFQHKTQLYIPCDNNGLNHFPKFARILTPEEVELKDWDVTLNDGLENEPYISDDFQIGPDGAYEHNETIKVQQELINVLESQIMDLTMMSKIELGDDVIAEIKRLKQLINEQTR